MNRINEKTKKIIVENDFQLNSLESAINEVDKIQEDEFANKFFKEESLNLKDSGVILDYKIKDIKEGLFKLAIRSGLPIKEFERAKESFRVFKKGNKEKTLFLRGHSLGGALVEYVTLTETEDELQGITFNSVNIEKFKKFNGNEFLGYKKGIKYYLDNELNENLDMRLIKEELMHLNVIKDYNISKEYRKNFGMNIDEKIIKKQIIKAVKKVLKISKEEAEELVEENFNLELIERKMKFIDAYNIENEKNIINYIFSDNIPARISNQIGSTYLVDKKLRVFNGGVDEDLNNWIDKLEENELKRLTDYSRDLFEPFILKKENGNGKLAKNRLGNTPELGNMTDSLSLDYLRGLIKSIVLDLKEKNDEMIKELFKVSQGGSRDRFLEIIKDDLRYSLKLEKKLKHENIFKSNYLRENSNILKGSNRIYRLADTALKQLDRMEYTDIEKLWKWEITPDSIILILGRKLEEGEEPQEFHSENTEKFTNEEKLLEVTVEELSNNKIYGSGKARRRDKVRDNEYISKESYGFLPNKGIGKMVISKHTDPNKTVKVNGKSIAGKYFELDENDKIETNLQGKYFGDNIFLTKTNGKENLTYYYGPDKKDKLVIDSFEDGDYGIYLERKISKYKETKVPLTYTEQKIKIGDFEFINLEKFELKKSINKHSTFIARGRVKHEEKQKYENLLLENYPSITITHGEEEIPIFKGVINKYKMDDDYIGEDLILEISGISHSYKLEHKRKTRIFQNMGTMYTDVFEKIIEENPEFDIGFSVSEMENTEIITKEYPLVLQYKESEWDFLKRISSYLNLPIIVNDVRDPSEMVNIKVGVHELPSKPLNNKYFEIRRERKGIKNYSFCKTRKHCHSLSDNIYGVGYPVDYNIDIVKNKKEEMIILKNKIYISKGNLYSDITLATKEKIDVTKKRAREEKIKGLSFRAQVKDVFPNHTIKAKFLDIEDDFKKGDAHQFPIDKIYTNKYFSPEKDDIVDVYMKGKNEKYATIKSCTTDNGKEDFNNPKEKRIISKTKQEILLSDEDKSIAFTTLKEECLMKMKEEFIDIKNKTASLKMQNDDTIELASGDRKLNISKEGLYQESDGNRIDMNKEGLVMTANKNEKISMKGGALVMEAGGKKIGLQDGEIILK